MSRLNIAIDGPAGAGKSTVAKIISQKLGIIYLDTGAMYRAVALKAIREKINALDREKLSALVQNINIKIEYAGSEQHVFLDGEDVSERIRTPEVSKAASDVATVPQVRIRMVEMQREIARDNDVVMDGRDIGTHVLPNATLKVFLTASVEERAKRRYAEQVIKGNKDISFDDVRRDIEYRDKNDSSRDFSPLSKADDAVEIDTTYMTIEEVADRIISLVGERR